MHYVMLLKSHANVRYRQSLTKLALAELQCLLRAWAIDAEATSALIAGEEWIAFDTAPLCDAAWQCVSRHSGVCFAAELMENGMLRPLERNAKCYVAEDLPHVLKYKGKTNVDFTMLMLHCARAVSDYARSENRLTVLDPLCGKATTLFCAMTEGYDAVGIDRDGKALAEADGYLSRALTLHRIKHGRETGSRTLPGGKSAKTVTYTYADTAEHIKTGDVRTLCLIEGETTALRWLVKPASCHLLVGDLPYGVQHAPLAGKDMTSLQRLVAAAMPGYAAALKPGGAMALSFNVNTLKRTDVERAMNDAGLEVLEDTPDFLHWVEQAVDRDVAFAKRK